MSSVLYSLGRWAVQARRLVVVGWIAVLVLVGGMAALFNQGLDNEVSIPGTESQAALDRLASTFPQVSGASAQVVVVAPDGVRIDDDSVRGPVEDGVDALTAIEQVAGVTSPYDDLMPASVSDDESAVLLTVQLDGEQETITDETRAALETAVDDLATALPAGSQASLGGQLYSNEFPEMTLTEGLGLVVALVVLVLTLGSFVAAGLPLLNALAGVGISMGLLFAATALAPINSTTPMLAVMLGLAVGIDYALFIVSRHRDQLRDGLAVEESIARSVATAGSAVIFAGLTVMIALVGLGVAGIPFLTTMGVAAAVAVGVAVLVSITLVPAMLGAAGERLRPRPGRSRTRRSKAAPVASGEHHNRFFAGWVRTVTRMPAVTIAIVVVAIGLLSVPALNLRLALPDAGSLPESSSARVTYDLVSENFGEGYNGPLIVTGSIVTSTDPVGLMEDLADEIRQLPGVADVPLATPNQSADTGIIQVVPEGAPDSEETEDLVHEIRSLHDRFLDEHGVDLSVTGFTAVGIDVSEKLGAALLPFALVVVGLSLVLLTMVFRSVWVPVKATIGYLLSVGAAFGVVSLVFDAGVLADALHVTRLGPVISFMPIVLMGVLFGLAMDYEVFLVARIREDYVHSGDALTSISTGFQGSAKVVTAAAVIMFAVFVAFVPEGDMNLKPIALGLAVGVAVDAFVVRMVFVPAVLALLGDKAWWMPRWLDRALPSFDVEGEGLAKELALADWPEKGATDAVVAHDLVVAGPRGPIAGPVTVRVPDGGVLLVHGPAPAAVSGLLLALAGRLRPAAGAVKVTGLVLPERAGAVRRRVAVVDLADGLPGAVDHALAEGPRVLVLDRTDAVVGQVDRRDLASAVDRARAAGVTVVLGAVGAVPFDLAPPGAQVLDLAAAERAGRTDTADGQQIAQEVHA
ncbi:MMPL family transporter [Oerskovia flava]|uniref:MMPL family transporter n=1 Tax=Oerskovia flava TaxID=2986422 RepID=UPI00223EEED2|nr:MMPL family transporter [Oerskovia sp. JB1-3-2]